MFLFNHFFFLSPAAASSLGSFFPAFSFFYAGFFSAFGAMGTKIRENKTLGEGKAWMKWMLRLASCMHTKESEMMFERKRLREKRLGIGMRGVHGCVIPACIHRKWAVRLNEWNDGYEDGYGWVIPVHGRKFVWWAWTKMGIW